LAHELVKRLTHSRYKLPAREPTHLLEQLQRSALLTKSLQALVASGRSAKSIALAHDQLQSLRKCAARGQAARISQRAGGDGEHHVPRAMLGYGFAPVAVPPTFGIAAWQGRQETRHKPSRQKLVCKVGGRD
jgi:hypothetical protein